MVYLNNHDSVMQSHLDISVLVLYVEVVGSGVHCSIVDMLILGMEGFGIWPV